MRHYVKIVGLVLALSAAFAAGALAEEPARADLGRTVKLTILVDKVMQPHIGWDTEEWIVKETAEAGFNGFSPRVGYDDLDKVRQVTQWCAKYGIYHMPWMRGSLTAPDDASGDGQRLVWANGAESPLWSPNSDAFWDWTTKYIAEYAQISAENGHLMGVFLDYENYTSTGQGNLYSLSYDGEILGKFAAAKGIDLPELPPAERKAWLESKGLHDAFAAFQVDHWRARCRALREAVDAFDPTFRFCIYPAPGTPFMVEAIYPEWATARAPLILADASTYGRPSRFMPEQEALRVNREKLLRNREIPTGAGIPFIYAGGIDPLVRGADPEFSGKNAVMISQVTDGYWIFYEGPTFTQQDHADYWKWFTWANKAIAAGDFDVQFQPRETPDGGIPYGIEARSDGRTVIPPQATGETRSYPRVRLRRDGLLVLATVEGQPVEVTLQNEPVGDYESPLTWRVYDASGGMTASGNIPDDESGVVAFTPATSGLHTIVVAAGPRACSVTRANVPVGLRAAEGLSLIGEAERLYFHVPADVERFVVKVRGAGGETARVNVFDPMGAQRATGQTTPAANSVEIEVAPEDVAGGTWALQVTRADVGAFEDSQVTLDPKLLSILSLAPEEVFRLSPAP